MNFVYLCFLNSLTLTVANDCECEVEPWGDWGPCSATCEGVRSKTRICSTNNGWTLGLSCHTKDETPKFQYQTCNPRACRE